MSGFKAAEDCLMLLQGDNASGDFKIKPMTVYHLETPETMKGFFKEHLTVFWKANKKAWVIVDIFQQWYVFSFCPAVKWYCKENNMEP